MPSNIADGNSMTLVMVAIARLALANPESPWSQRTTGSSTRVKPLDADELGVRTMRDLNADSEKLANRSHLYHFSLWRTRSSSNRLGLGILWALAFSPLYVSRYLTFNRPLSPAYCTCAPAQQANGSVPRPPWPTFVHSDRAESRQSRKLSTANSTDDFCDAPCSRGECMQALC